MKSSRQQLGLWLVGAAGNVATTVAVGLAAMRRGLAPAIGLATEQPPVSSLALTPLANIVLGGHEISRRTVIETASILRERSGLFGEQLLQKVKLDLARFQREIRTGHAARSGRAISRLASRDGALEKQSARAVIDRFRRDLRGFAKRNRLDRVVVVHVASTEPPFALGKIHQSWRTLRLALERPTPPLPASSLYAIAALEEKMPFIGFTPCLGCNVPGIRQLAEENGVPIMGSDGKTGETLLKTVLAPMFRDRFLRVESWVGHNILGNGDGFVLDSIENKSAKLEKKDAVVGSIVGNRPQTRTTIEYVESLHDWKTAWDHVHFTGFLGVKMMLQFIWQGCDSILAAPLVIDLARLAEYHARSGRGGVMRHLALFFKSPMDVTEHDFSRQVALLHDYVAAQRTGRKTRR